MFTTFILLATTALAHDCGPRFDETERSRVSPAEAVDLVAMLLPSDHVSEFRRRAERVLARPVQITTGRARLKYRPRWLDWGVVRAARARVLWNDRAPATPAEKADLIAATIDLVTEANFTPVRRPSIYRRRAGVFIDQNVSLVRDKLLYHLFTLGAPASDAREPGPLARALRTVLRPLLPGQFAVIRGARLTPAHVAVFLEEGPAGLYTYLRRREGAELAVRYWFTHLTNVQAALTAGYLAAVMPSIYEAWRYVFDLHLVEVDDRATGTARAVLRAMRDTPDHVIAHGRRLFERLPPAERRALYGLFGG